MFSLFYAGNTSFTSDSTIGEWKSIYTNVIDLDFTDDLDLHGAKDNQVEETWLDRVELHMIEPVNANFVFLDAVEIYLIADGLDTIKLASDAKLYEQSTSRKITVPLATDIDLEEYLRKPQMQYMLRFTQHNPTLIDHHIKINSKIRVDSRRFGV